MHKKIFIILFFIFIFTILFQTTFAKYVIKDTQVVAKLNIDRCKPNIELVDITSSNKNYPTYANQTHIISGHLKLIEKNIVRNNLSFDSLKVAVGNRYAITENDYITPTFKSFSLISENETEKIYEFSFTNTINDGALVLIIPEGTIEDKSRSSK